MPYTCLGDMSYSAWSGNHMIEGQFALRGLTYQSSDFLDMCNIHQSPLLHVLSDFKAVQ